LSGTISGYAPERVKTFICGDLAIPR